MMKKLRLLLTLSVICGIFAGCSGKEPDIVVGAKDFTEQHILGHMLVLLIEANTNLKVSYRSDLSSDVIFAGIRTGVVDLYVDYTGTVYSGHLKYSDSTDPEEVHKVAARELKDKFNLRMLDPLGFNNTFYLAVRTDTAAEHGLRTFSDLAKVSSGFIFGGSAEILARFDGIPNLKRVYDMSFKEERAMDGAARYIAITNDEIQVTEVFSTDGFILEYALVVLEDNKSFFPPYQGVVVITDDAAEKYPELPAVLGKLTGILTDDIMRDLNYRVDMLNESPGTVAEKFLRARNLIR